jgi:hypothetical protein
LRIFRFSLILAIFGRWLYGGSILVSHFPQFSGNLTRGSWWLLVALGGSIWVSSKFSKISYIFMNFRPWLLVALGGSWWLYFAFL